MIGCDKALAKEVLTKIKTIIYGTMQFLFNQFSTKPSHITSTMFPCCDVIQSCPYSAPWTQPNSLRIMGFLIDSERLYDWQQYGYMNCHVTIHVTVLLLSKVMPYTTIQIISSLQHIEFMFPSNYIERNTYFKIRSGQL